MMKSKFTSIKMNAVATIILLITAQSHGQVPDPTRFEQEIKTFEQQDLVNKPPTGAIVITGSSSIARWNTVVQEMAPLTVIPRGFGGSNMNDLSYYLERIVIKYQPRAIVIYEGDNDTAMSPPVSKETILKQLKHIISRVHQALPNTRIYILSIKPSVLRQSVWPSAQQVSQAYKTLAEQTPLLHYIDIASPLLKADGSVMQDIFVTDNLHLNEKGYGIWSKTIKEALMPIEHKFE